MYVYIYRHTCTYIYDIRILKSTVPVFVLGIALSHLQDLTLSLVELHEVHTGPSLQPVRVPLDGVPALQAIDHLVSLGTC